MHSRARTLTVGVLLMMIPGAVYGFSSLSQPLSVAFHWPALALATAFGLSLLCNGVAAAVGGAQVDRHGPQRVALLGVGLIAAGDLLIAVGTPHLGLPWFFLCYGVVGGAGCGLAYIAGMSTVMRTQSRRFGFGAGLAALGFGLGSLVYGIVLRATPQFAAVSHATSVIRTAEEYAAAHGVEMSATASALAEGEIGKLMGIFVGNALTIAVVGGLVVSQLRNLDVREANVEDRTVAQAAQTMQWWFIWAMYFAATIAGGGIIGNAIAILHEITALPAAALTEYIVLLALAGCIGRIGMGALVDRVGYKRLLSTLLLVQATIYFGLSVAHDLHVALLLFASAFLCFGGIVALLTGWTAQSFGTRHFGAIWGLLTTGFGTAGLLGPWFISAVHSINGTYTGALMPMGLMLAMTAALPAAMRERGEKASFLVARGLRT